MTEQPTGSEAAQAATVRYFSAHGPVTDPGPMAGALASLPAHDPLALCRALQGLMVHIFWAKRYGLLLDQAREQEVNLRWVRQQLHRLQELDPAPLTTARPLERRLVGNCRDFATLFVSALRQHGFAARARCGFATYFRPGGYEDHWVAEVYDPAAGRWRMIDPQIDDFQAKALSLDFDPTDMAAGRFLTGGEAWRLCRAGEADPERFGIFDMRGMWFVRGDLVRDFLALNRIEILPWDPWGLMAVPGAVASASDLADLDRVAALCSAPDANLGEIQRLMAEHPALATRPGWWADEQD